MRYKTTYLSIVVAVGLVLASCSRSVSRSTLAAGPKCKMLASPNPIRIEIKSISLLLEDFKNSRNQCDALWIKIRGGQPIYYRRIQLFDQNVWFCQGQENDVPKYEHRAGFPAIEKLFIQLHSGHYMGEPFLNYSTEPGLEALYVKKSGVTICSYALDLDCLYNLTDEEQAKIVDAQKLAAYMKRLM